MTWPELHQTLTQLVSAIEPPDGSGLRVDAVDLTVPLETATSMDGDRLVLLARVPHSRWTSGFLREVSVSRFAVELALPAADAEVPSR